MASSWVRSSDDMRPGSSDLWAAAVFIRRLRTGHCALATARLSTDAAGGPAQYIIMKNHVGASGWCACSVACASHCSLGGRR